jgi:hypothetical protein
MIEKIKAYWPVYKAALDLAFYVGIVLVILVCMFRREWMEGAFWASFYCMWKLTDIKELLNDRL